MNKQKMLLSVSTDMAKDLDEKIDYLKFLQNEKIDYIHMDIMDGQFVDNVSYDYKEVELVNSHTVIPIDVHMMVKNPTRFIEMYAKAGANILTVHKEAFTSRERLLECLKEIKEQGMLVGLAIELETSERFLVDVMPLVDVVLILAVRAGSSGQRFDERVYKKIQIVDEMRTRFKFNFKIEVDGGVNANNIAKIKELGADIVVSSSFLYKSEDRTLDIKRLRQ